MSTKEQIKRLLAETVYSKASKEAARILVMTPEPEIKELDTIAYKHMIGLLIPRTYEQLKKDWEWATGGSIPITTQDALDHYEKHTS